MVSEVTVFPLNSHKRDEGCPEHQTVHGATDNALTLGLLRVILIIPGLSAMIHHAAVVSLCTLLLFHSLQCCFNQHNAQYNKRQGNNGVCHGEV